MAAKNTNSFKILLLIAFMINSVIAFGQFKITGTINDTSKMPIAQATLKLLKDTSVIHTTSSDAAGNFKFTGLISGGYLIEGTYQGNKVSSGLLILYKDTAIILSLKTGSELNLKEVTITADKPLLERKIDRLVFNVSNSIAAKGTDLTQALALTPMLRVDDNSVSIIGKSGIAVMINDRIVNIGGADLINYLRSLRSDDVEKIEVITTPPAKYEAQGNSGMINIVLKKNPNIGWSGSMSSTFAKTTYPGFANNFNLNYQSQKLSTSIKLRQYHRMTHPTENINVIGINSILSSDSRKDIVYGYGGNLGVDYKLSQHATIGFIYDIGKLNYDMDIHNNSTYSTNSVTDSVLNTVTEQQNSTIAQTLNVYHDQKLGKSGQKLSTGLNFFSTIPETDVNFNTKSDQASTTSFVRNNSDLHYRIWSALADLTLPYKWATIESGLKFTNFDNNSETGYYNFIENSYQIDVTKSNQFEYHEKNSAGYISLQKDFNKQWSAKAGLRYEYSVVDAYSPTADAQNQLKYGRLFPSVYVSYKAGLNHTVSFSYSKRINRPDFRALNPFRWYSNPYVYSTGNPLLQPSFNHNAEFTYLYKGLLSFTLYGQKLKNGYGRITEVNNALKVVSYKNYLSQYNSGLEVNIGLKLFPWWENREFVSLNFTDSRSSIPEVLLQDGSAFYYSTYNTFTLSKNFSVFVNFWQSLPSTQGNISSNNRSYLSSGFRLALLENKLQFNVSADDLFKGTVSKGNIYYQDFTQTYNNYYDARKFSVTGTYTFGKAKVKGNKKQVNFKETDRAN